MRDRLPVSVPRVASHACIDQLRRNGFDSQARRLVIDNLCGFQDAE